MNTLIRLRSTHACGLHVRRFSTVLAVLLPVAMAGCRLHHSPSEESITTPVGGLTVQRDLSAVLDRIGLPGYPGAQAVSDNSDHGSANVDISFAGYTLRVLVAKLHTDDDPRKVETYYRGALQRYSDVIACRGNRPVGTPTTTGMGLTCSGDKHVDSNDNRGDSLQLKAGSPTRQHIVTIHSQGNGTRIDLVALDLPKGGE